MHWQAKLPGSTGVGIFKHGDILLHYPVQDFQREKLPLEVEWTLPQEFTQFPDRSVAIFTLTSRNPLLILSVSALREMRLRLAFYRPPRACNAVHICTSRRHFHLSKKKSSRSLRRPKIVTIPTSLEAWLLFPFHLTRWRYMVKVKMLYFSGLFCRCLLSSQYRLS